MGHFTDIFRLRVEMSGLRHAHGGAGMANLLQPAARAGPRQTDPLRGRPGPLPCLGKAQLRHGKQRLRHHAAGSHAALPVDPEGAAPGPAGYTLAGCTVADIILRRQGEALLHGLGPLPEMGVAGAALATVIGQWCGAALGVAINHVKNHEIRLRVKGFRPCWHTIGVIYRVGLPSIVMQSLSSVMVFGMNKILISFTTTATAVFGVYFKLQSFVFMPVFGLNNGMVPIVAFNYGARRPDRIMKTIKLSITYAVGIMLVGLMIFQFAPDVMLNLFRAEGDSGDMLTIGVPALRIISLSFLFAGYAIVCSSVFQALGHGVLSLTVSVVRQLVVLLPVGFLLSLTGNLELVWWAFPIAELFSLTLCTIFLRRVYLHEIKPLSEIKSK